MTDDDTDLDEERREKQGVLSTERAEKLEKTVDSAEDEDEDEGDEA